MDEQSKKAFGVVDAAAVLSVSPSQIRAMVRRGDLSAIREGARVLIPAIAIDSYITRKLHESEREPAPSRGAA